MGQVISQNEAWGGLRSVPHIPHHWASPTSGEVVIDCIILTIVGLFCCFEPNEEACATFMFDAPQKPAWKYLKTPLFIGVLIGIAIGVSFIPGGFDSYYRLLRDMPDFVPTPAWVYLITIPLSKLGWPLSWQVFVLITVLVTAFAHVVIFRDKSKWWTAVLNSAMIWNIWLGNIEGLIIAGFLIGYLVVQKKLHPIWWGIGAVLMFSKPQVGVGLIVLFTFWIWREQGFRKLVLSIIPVAFIWLVCSLIWPDWIDLLIRNTVGTSYDWWNGSIFPWGLIGWIPALLPIPMAKVRRMRLVSAATLLSSPYLALYHCATLCTLYNKTFVLVLSYVIIVLGLLFTDNWMKLAWILPAVCLIYDACIIFLERRQTLDSQEI